MSANWKVGNRALCVDDSAADARLHIPRGNPKRGVVYLVDSIGISRITGNPYLRINDHPVIYPDGKLVGWRPSRFRKLVPACDRIAQTETVEGSR